MSRRTRVVEPVVSINLPLLPEDYTDRADRMSKIISLHSNPQNLKRLLLKNRMPPRCVSFLETVWEILEKNFPGRGDIQFGVVPVFEHKKNLYGYVEGRYEQYFTRYRIGTVYLVVHHPEVTIVNSKNNSVTITDLYTRVPIDIGDKDRDRFFFRNLEGNRATISPIEYLKGYSHSHLPTKPYSTENRRVEWKHFCMGNADYKASVSLLNSEHTVDYDMITLMLLQIEPYIRWESISGGPHISMHNVVKRKLGSNISMNLLISLSSRIQSYLSSKPNALDVDWKLHNNRFYIIDNQKLEDCLKCIFITNDPIDRSYYGYRDERGEFYVEDKNITPEIAQVYPEWIPFRNKKVYFTVAGNIKSHKEGDTLFIHPKIKEYVKQRLEYAANYEAVKQSGIN